MHFPSYLLGQFTLTPNSDNSSETTTIHPKELPTWTLCPGQLPTRTIRPRQILFALENNQLRHFAMNNYLIRLFALDNYPLGQLMIINPLLPWDRPPWRISPNTCFLSPSLSPSNDKLRNHGIVVQGDSFMVWKYQIVGKILNSSFKVQNSSYLF